MTRSNVSERIAQAKRVNIVEWLKSQGYSIDETAGYYRCSSPLRSESNPSFDINKKTLKWVDRGNGKRGDIIDCVRLIHGCGMHEAIDKLLGNTANFDHPELKPVQRDKPNIEILSVEPLSSPKLIDYITSRKISVSIASQWLKQASIRFPYGKNPDRIEKVVAWRNDSSGYEFRNGFLKVSNAPKNVTTIQRDSYVINLFEGWPDALTFMTMVDDRVLCTYIVLNSASFFEIMIPFLYGHHINYFGHADPTGEKIYKRIVAEGISVRDYRVGYNGHKDLNDAWVARTKLFSLLSE